MHHIVKDVASLITMSSENHSLTALFQRVSHFQTRRQTDRYFIDRNKSHYKLIWHSNKRDICTCIYKNASLLKSYDNIHGMTNN